MPDFASAVQVVATIVGASSTEPPEGDQIKLAIVEAIHRLRKERLTFNFGELTIGPLVVGVANEPTGRKFVPGTGGSDLPLDYLNPLDSLWLRDTTSPTNVRDEMIAVTNGMYDVRRGESAENNGTPLYWTIKGDDLWITPAPDRGDFELLGSYIVNLPTPAYTISSGVYTWSPDGFLSQWFIPGEGMETLVQKAASIYNAVVLKEQATAQANRVQADEALESSLVTERERSEGDKIAVFWPGDPRYQSFSGRIVSGV